MLAHKFKPTFLMDTQGHKTHAVIPFEEWELLTRTPVEPDDQDLAIIARLERERVESPEDFKETPVTNPIRKARLAAKIRQEDLAAAMRITQPALSKLEREGHKFRPTTLARALVAVKALGK